MVAGAALWPAQSSRCHGARPLPAAAGHSGLLSSKCSECEKQKLFCLALTSERGGAAVTSVGTVRWPGRGPPYDRPAAGLLSSPRCGAASRPLCLLRAAPRRAGFRIPTGSLSEKRSCPRCSMLGSNVPLVWRRPPHSAAVPPCQLGPRFSRRDQPTGLREDSLVHLSGFCSTYKSNVSSALVVKKNETLRKCTCEPRSAHALAVF